MKRYFLLKEEWARHPPVDWIAAAYVQYKGPEAVKNEKKANTRKLFERVKNFGGAFGI